MDRRTFLQITGSVLAGHLLSPGKVLASQWVDKWWNSDEIDGEQLPDTVAPTGTLTIPKFCDGFLRLKNSIFGGSSDFHFRDTAGNYNQKVLSELNWFLRCRDGSWQYMDIRAIEALNYLSALMGVPEIQVNSGYRSPQYNRYLARTNENVARNSLHQYGRAIDFFIPGIATREVCSYALYARNTMGYGGIGYYPRAGFVHLDSGVSKQWVAK